MWLLKLTFVAGLSPRGTAWLCQHHSDDRWLSPSRSILRSWGLPFRTKALLICQTVTFPPYTPCRFDQRLISILWCWLSKSSDSLPDCLCRGDVACLAVTFKPGLIFRRYGDNNSFVAHMSSMVSDIYIDMYITLTEAAQFDFILWDADWHGWTRIQQKVSQLTLRKDQHFFSGRRPRILLFLIRCFRVNPCTIILWDTDEHGYCKGSGQLALRKWEHRYYLAGGH